jgi:hypothetical protein
MTWMSWNSSFKITTFFKKSAGEEERGFEEEKTDENEAKFKTEENKWDG